jgi:hypothetical protein
MNKGRLDAGGWYIVGIRLHSDREYPEFYSALYINSKNVALTAGGKLAFFNTFDRGSELLTKFAPESLDEDRYLSAVSGVCDMPLMMDIVKTGRFDREGIVVNTINTLTDFLYTIDVIIPEFHKTPLYSIADFCTFDRSIATFFRESNVTSQQLLDACYWCLGAVQMNSCLV